MLRARLLQHRLGPAYARSASGCEGYCQGGAGDELPCSQDSQCPGGNCVGSNPVHHPAVCNCVCEAGGLGALLGRTQDWKKAYVRLADGQAIDYEAQAMKNQGKR